MQRILFGFTLLGNAVLAAVLAANSLDAAEYMKIERRRVVQQNGPRNGQFYVEPRDELSSGIEADPARG
jgi:hypothetical protein